MASNGGRTFEGHPLSQHMCFLCSSPIVASLHSQAAIDVVTQLEAASRQLRGLHRCLVVEELIPVISSAAAIVKRVLQQVYTLAFNPSISHVLKQKSEQQEFRQCGVDLLSSGGPLKLTLQLLVEVR